MPLQLNYWRFVNSNKATEPGTLAESQLMEAMMMKLLVVGLVVSLLGSGWVVLLARLAMTNSHDPRAILRRCKARLRLVRRELDLIPATREIYNIYGEIEHTELTIKRTESLFHHATGK